MEALRNLRDYFDSDISIAESPCFQSPVPVNSDLCTHYAVAKKPAPGDIYFEVFPCFDKDGSKRKDEPVGIPVRQHLDDLVSAQFVEGRQASPAVV